jgi:hypothetical protein
MFCTGKVLKKWRLKTMGTVFRISEAWENSGQAFEIT